MLQGRLDAVQATNQTLQHQLAAVHRADAREFASREVEPVRAKAAPGRSSAARPPASRLACKATAAPVTPNKTGVRRKRGRTDDR